MCFQMLAAARSALDPWISSTTPLSLKTLNIFVRPLFLGSLAHLFQVSLYQDGVFRLTDIAKPL